MVAYLLITYLIFLVSESEIAKLPEDDVPESIWETIQRIENIADGNAERTGFTVDPLADATTQGELNIDNNFPMSTR